MDSWLFFAEAEEVLPASARDFLFAGALPFGWSLSRASPARQRGGDGRWVEVAADTPRLYHDPVTLELRGMLVEAEARTQYNYNSAKTWLTSTGLTSDGTTANNLIVNVADTPSPIGTITAQRHIPTSASVAHNSWLDLDGRANYGTSPPDNSAVTVLAHLKPVGYTRFAMEWRNKANAIASVTYSTANGGSVLANSGGAGGRIWLDTDGFFALEMVVPTNGSGSTVPRWTFHVERDDGARVFAGSPSSAWFDLGYIGIENGRGATSPIVTAGSSATRAADALTSTLAWLSTGPRSFGVVWTPLYAPGRDTNTVLQFDGTGLVTLRATTSSPNGTQLTVTNSGTTQASMTSGSGASFTPQTVVFTVADNAFFLAQTGSATVTDTSGTAPSTHNILRIGAQTDGSLAGPLVLRRLRYWQSGLSVSQVAVLAADLDQGPHDERGNAVSIQTEAATPNATGTLRIAVTRSDPGEAGTVAYATSNGTATTGTDYSAQNGTITFAAGQAVGLINIPILASGATVERTFTVSLSNPSGGIVLGSETCTVTIVRTPSGGVAPTINNDFGAALPAQWTVVAASGGMTQDSAGVWSVAATDTARTVHRSDNNTPRAAVLIESGRTQLLHNSLVNAGGTSGWSWIGSSVTSNNAAANGLPIATPNNWQFRQMRESDSTSAHRVERDFAVIGSVPAAGTTYTVWAYVRPVGSPPRVNMRVRMGDGTNHSATWETGTWTVVSGGLVGAVIARSEPIYGFPNWWRIGLTWTESGSGTAPLLSIGCNSASGAVYTESYAGSSARGFDYCHVQLEAGSIWSSPIANAGTATKARAADTINAAGSWLNHSQFTVGFRAHRLVDTANQRIVRLTDNGTGGIDDVGLRFGSTTMIAPVYRNGTFLKDMTSTPLPAIWEPVTVLVRATGANVTLWQAGTQHDSQTLATPLDPLTIGYLGHRNDGGQMGSVGIEKMRFWNTALTDGECATFSANLDAVPAPTDAGLPVVSLPTAMTVGEDDTATITLTKVGAGACSVTVSTQSHTATESDYTPISGAVVSFASGDTTKTIALNTLGDSVSDDNETLIVRLSSPSNCLIGTGACQITITEAPVVEPPPPSEFSYPALTSLSVAGGITGGMGKPIYKVTNLSNDMTGGTTGSFGWALAQARNSGGGIVVFEISGAIDYNWGETGGGTNFNFGNLTRLRVPANTTIAGETAPSPGINLYRVKLLVRESNVIIRHLRIVPSAYSDNWSFADQVDAFDIQVGSNQINNILIDHCTTAWTCDEGIHILRFLNSGDTSSGRIERLSITNCLIAEPLAQPHTASYNHNYGCLIGPDNKPNWGPFDFHFNMFAGCDMRTPRFGGGTTISVLNSVCYNNGIGISFERGASTDPNPPYYASIVGNLRIKGPNQSTSTGGRNVYTSWASPDSASQLYHASNYGTEDVIADTIGIRSGYSHPPLVGSPPSGTWHSSWSALSRIDVYERARNNVGCRPKDKGGNPYRVHPIDDNVIYRMALRWGGNTDANATRVWTTLKTAADLPAVVATTRTLSPPSHTNTAAVRDWLRGYLEAVQYDTPGVI